MPTLGEELKRRREERDIPLADISEATKIGTRFLKAIESNNFSTLPGGIFTRSFIRAYAKAVGMNEDEAIGLYQQQTAVQREEPQPQTVIEQPLRPAQQPSRSNPPTIRRAPTQTSWPTIIITGGIIIFLAIIVFAIVKKLNEGSRESVTTPTNNSSVAQRNETPSPAPQTGPAKDQPSAQPPSVPKGDQLIVKIEATESDLWTRYQVDEAQPVTMTLKPGEAQDLPPAQNQVKLNIGNRAALKLVINDREVTSFPPDTKLFAAQVTISRDNLREFFQ
ncbi:MAG: helix-turn-helix domain-containing protein [Blastocatellia bacterium]|nr:helix-turn-helix domain-containing protein [Blastocatellia bacterium]